MQRHRQRGTSGSSSAGETGGERHPRRQIDSESLTEARPTQHQPRGHGHRPAEAAQDRPDLMAGDQQILLRQDRGFSQVCPSYQPDSSYSTDSASKRFIT